MKRQLGHIQLLIIRSIFSVFVNKTISCQKSGDASKSKRNPDSDLQLLDIDE